MKKKPRTLKEIEHWINVARLHNREDVVFALQAEAASKSKRSMFKDSMNHLNSLLSKSEVKS